MDVTHMDTPSTPGGPSSAHRPRSTVGGSGISKFISHTVSRANTPTRGSGIGGPSRRGTAGLPKDESWSSGLSSTPSGPSTIFDSIDASLATDAIVEAGRLSHSEEGDSLRDSGNHSLSRRRSTAGGSGDVGLGTKPRNSTSAARTASGARTRELRKSGERDRSASMGKVEEAPASKRVLSPGGGTGWEFFRRDTLHIHRYQPFDEKTVPWQLPYSREQIDFDVLRTAANIGYDRSPTWINKLHPDFVPTRVLDLGCGVSAFWIMEAARLWPNAHFVGLDIAPVLLPKESLPEQVRNRVSFVQANMLQRLPFESESFDLVRISHVGLGVPEKYWVTIFDEAVRVLRSKTGWIQCSDASLRTAQEDEDAPKREEIVATPDYLEDDAIAQVKLARFKQYESAAAAMHAKSLISPYPTAIFPASLLLTVRNMISDGPTHWHAPTGMPSHSNLDTAEGMQEIAMRVLEHANANAMPIELLWEATHKDRETAQSKSMREKVAFEKSMEDLRSDIRHRAGISQLLGERFGWQCSADKVIEDSLHKQVLALKIEREALKAEQAVKTESMEVRMMEVDRALRESVSELEAARKRLGKVEGDSALQNRAFVIETTSKAGQKPLSAAV